MIIYKFDLMTDTTSKKGLAEGKTRTTYILNNDNVEKIKDIAYWDRIGINELADSILQEFIKKYERKNGPIKPRKE